MKKKSTNENGVIRSFHDYLVKDSVPESSQSTDAGENSIDEVAAILNFTEALRESQSLELPASPSVPDQTTEPIQEAMSSPESLREEIPSPVLKEERKTFEGYRIVRDRDENFECNLTVEGTSLAEAQARLVLDGDPYNLVFYGKIHSDGKCVIPIRKGLPLHEGAQGKIRLEVIAEDQLFVGWEDQFLVETSKKLKVELKEQKSVKVNFVNK